MSQSSRKDENVIVCNDDVSTYLPVSPFLRRALFHLNQPSRQQSRYFVDSIFCLMTVEKAMLNNDLLQSPAGCEYTALYVPATSVAKPAYCKTTPVVVRNNYCNARLQGVFYARPVNSPRNMYSVPNHDIGIRLIVGD